ncbi:TPA: chemotaxis protein CheW [Patescibacteria group bacterium]|nr:chemotaxis protein CheW [Candidatus Gracilibacteria bacterium]
MATTEKQVNSGTDEKYLTFTLKTGNEGVNDEEYGVLITEVREIIGMMPISAIPKSPDFLKGVINLRGKVIPITDLRTKFEMPERPHDEHTCIIVMEVSGKNVGMVVDVVSEVIKIDASEIQTPQSLGDEVSHFVLGLAKKTDSNKVIILINPKEIFTMSQELEEAI